MKKTGPMILAAILVWLAAVPAAGIEIWEGSIIKIDLPGYYRLRAVSLDRFQIYGTPSVASEDVAFDLYDDVYGTQRVRIEPKVTFFDKYVLHIQADLLNGPIFGNKTNRYTQVFAEEPRAVHDGWDLGEARMNRIWAEIPLKSGTLKVGRQGSQWGIGMLANGGDGFTNDWGDAHYGDSVNRILYGTKPISIFRKLFKMEPLADDPLTWAFAWDWTVQKDSKANHNEDEVQNIINALLFERDWLTLGFYAVYRDHEHTDQLIHDPSFRPNPEFLRVWAFDWYGNLSLTPWEDWEFFLMGELALVTGKTNLAVSQAEQTVDDPFPESDVLQLGWTLRGGARLTPGARFLSSIELNVEGGYASGDDNPVDDEIRNFRFHPDYNVSLIMFEEVLAAQSAASAYVLFDKLGESGPVRSIGTDMLATDGAVTNAIYVKPTLKATLLEGLDAVASVLYAMAAQDIVDPYNDVVLGSGGYGEYNVLGGPSSNKEYGWEVDFGVSYTLEFPDFQTRLGIQYGHFFPGNAFTNGRNEKIDDIDTVQGRLTLLW